MLDLETAVHLDEVERAVRADEELERPGVAVADRLARARDRRLHRLSCRRIERRRRRLLDELLVAALDRALALAERQHATGGVAEHLDLDMTSRRHELLDVDRAVAERSLRLGARPGERVFELVLREDEPHALPSTSRRRLEQDGKAGAPQPPDAAPPARSHHPSPAPAGHPPRASPPSRAPCRPSARRRPPSAR